MLTGGVHQLDKYAVESILVDGLLSVVLNSALRWGLRHRNNDVVKFHVQIINIHY